VAFFYRLLVAHPSGTVGLLQVHLAYASPAARLLGIAKEHQELHLERLFVAEK